MKKFLLAAWALALVFAPIANAQNVFISEDFENGTMPSGWNQTTSASDGGWLFDDAATLASTGWPIPTTNNTLIAATNDDACDCNKSSDILITPSMDWSSASSVFLEFDSYYIEGSYNGVTEEAYIIYTTDGGANWFVAYTMPGGTTNDWDHQVLDLSSLAGGSLPGNSTIQLAFAYGDMGDWLYGFAIDNVEIYEPVAGMDAAITSLDETGNGVGVGMQLPVEGTLTNYSASNLTSFTLNYTIDNGAVITDFVSGVSIAPGGTYDFVHGTPWTGTTIGTHTLEVYATNLNGQADANPSNDAMSKPIEVASQVWTRQVLCEEFTSSTCIPCANYNPGYNTLLNANGVNTAAGKVLSIKYQMNWPAPGTDPAYNPDGVLRQTYYAVPAIPYVWQDGIFVAQSIDQAAIDAGYNEPAFVGISATKTITGNTLDVDVTLTPGKDFNNSVSCHIAVVENTINHNVQTNGETEFYQVMRKMLPDGDGTTFLGLTDGIPVNVNESYTFSTGSVAQGNHNLFTNLNNTTVIVFVQDDNSGEVLQATLATDGGGCNVTASSTSTPASCSGNDGAATAFPSNGTSPYTYSWSNGQSGATATGLGAGTYTVTVTDNDGCTVTETVNIGSSGGATVNTSQSNPACGASDGTATAVATGGQSPYTYSWSNGGSSATATNLGAGTYTVTVTDAQGCETVSTVSLSASGGPTVTTAGTDANCGPSGAATANATGGQSPYTYSWSNGQSNQIVSGLSAGTYTVTVTDANNCTQVQTVTIDDVGAGPAVALATTDLACYGSTDGAAIATSSGGTQPYTYLWSTGQAGPAISNLEAGLYAVTVSDANQCVTIETFQLDEPDELLGSATATNSDCGLSTGTATVNGAGGTPSYTYLWDVNAGSSTSQQVSNLAAGTYSTTITDNNGCTVIAYAAVADNGAPIVSLNVTTPSCNGQSDGTIQTNVTGGATPYTYNWSTAATGTGIGSLPAGNYLLTVTDALGCQFVQAYTMVEPDPLEGTNQWTPANYPNCDGSATVNPTGGTAPYTYQWNSLAGNQTTQTAFGLCVGSYGCLVVDANGCNTFITAPVDSIVQFTAPQPQSIRSVKAFPNPASDVLYIDITLNKSLDTELRLYNTVGQLVDQKRLVRFSQGIETLNVAKYPKGIYLLEVATVDGTHSMHRIVLQ